MGQNIKLFSAIYEKMHWQEQRQKVIAQNIANADTVGYVPKDIEPIDFKDLLASSTSKISMNNGQSQLGLVTTNNHHIDTNGRITSDGSFRAEKQYKTYETAPAGNGVILEEQLLKANEIAMDHKFVSSIYKKNLNMLRTAIRGSGQ